MRRTRPAPAELAAQEQAAERQAAQERILAQGRADQEQHRREPGVPANPTPRVTTR